MRGKPKAKDADNRVPGPGTYELKELKTQKLMDWK
jgi:hypothetical protein